MVATTHPPTRSSSDAGSVLGTKSNRPVRPGWARGQEAETIDRGRPAHPDPTTLDRSRGSSPQPRSRAAIRGRSRPDGLRQTGRPTAGFSPVRRAVGSALARRGALRRERRIRAQRVQTNFVAVSRLGRPGVQRESPVRRVLPPPACRRCPRAHESAGHHRHRVPGRGNSQHRRGSERDGPEDGAAGRTGRPGRQRRPDVPGPDCQLRPLPRSQVRPDRSTGLLPVDLVAFRRRARRARDQTRGNTRRDQGLYRGAQATRRDPPPPPWSSKRAGRGRGPRRDRLPGGHRGSGRTSACPPTHRKPSDAGSWRSG